MSKRIVSEIWIYPVKSLGGVRVRSARVMPKGLEFDRRWMLIDEGNRFLTQREHPRMAFFKVSYSFGNFYVHHTSDTVELPFQSSGDSVRSVIWDDTVEVVEVSKKLSEWFSERLSMKCRFVSFPESNPRPVDPDYAINNNHVSLADGYPLLVIGQSSLDELNSRLKEPVPMNRFRPNLVFTGGEAFEEDNWKSFSVGKNRFAGVKRCDRCVLTTVNQDTGVKGTEPLATLSTYRKEGNKVFFGQNLIPLNYDEISEGDEIIF